MFYIPTDNALSSPPPSPPLSFFSSVSGVRPRCTNLGGTGRTSDSDFDSSEFLWLLGWSLRPKAQGKGDLGNRRAIVVVRLEVPRPEWVLAPNLQDFI